MPIFADGFETGNTLAWPLVVGEAPLVAPEVFRFNTLLVRDPHVFVSVPLAGCSDFTDTPLPFGLGPSFNAQIATSLTTDGDGDTFLDLSPLLQFRPLDVLASALRLDLAQGLCTAPVAGTSCTLDSAQLPRTVAYDGLAAGSCLGTVAGTTSGYTPAPTLPTLPCFVSRAAHHTVQFGDFPLPLRGVQISATFAGIPPTGLASGLLRGFLRETDAAQVLIPADVPLVGGQPITILLRGGAGNCAPGDDRDTFEGVAGWWFYWNFDASPVPFTGT
ncbi:MAG: hypothetical protein U0002_09060 [Thermoanaerobaculia bacterium]